MTCLRAAGDGFLFDYSYDDDCGVDGERDGDYSNNGNSDGNTVAGAMVIAMSGSEGDGNNNNDCEYDGERSSNYK